MKLTPNELPVRGSPSNRDLAQTLLEHVGPTKELCLLCGNEIEQQPSKDCTNIITHLKDPHKRNCMEAFALVKQVHGILCIAASEAAVSSAMRS